MMKLILTFLIVLCLASIAFATQDLVIEDFQLKTNDIEPGQKYHYTLSVKNIGDMPATTALRTKVWFNMEDEPMQPNKLLSLYAEGRNYQVVKPITVIASDGTESSLETSFGELKYMLPAETPEKIQDRKDSFLERAATLDYSEEEITQTLEEIEIQFSQPHLTTSEEIFITLYADETAVYDSEESYNGFGAISFPIGDLENDWPVLSTEPIVTILNMKLMPFDATEEIANNLYVAQIIMQPNVLQGPLPETETNKELDDESEYFSRTAGCGTINEKYICVHIENEEADDMDEILTIEVDGQNEYYSMYNLWSAWFFKIFSDGKLAQSKVINGVKITLYDSGLKYEFN
jgi:hypothetical protein